MLPAMQFGVHAGLQNTTTAELQSLWRRIEDHGFDWISIWDHFYAADASIRGRQRAVRLPLPRSGRPRTPRSR